MEVATMPEVVCVYDQERNRIVDALRRAVASGATSADAAVQALREGITSLQDSQGAQPLRELNGEEKIVVEGAFRYLLDEYTRSAYTANAPVMQHRGEPPGAAPIMPRLLDLALSLCESNKTEAGLILLLFEDLLEGCSIADCGEAFTYMESKLAIIGRKDIFLRGKLIVLRTCTELLRRLSKCYDLVLSGRVHMFLANLFPLNDKSGANPTGAFNLSNITTFEDEQAAAGSLPESNGGKPLLDYNFYKSFWSLQKSFQIPSTVIQPGGWSQLVSTLNVVLNIFESQPLSAFDTSSHKDSSNHDLNFYDTKYLTSSKLMPLQLRDPNFRRHMLVQCCILFQYLKDPKNLKDQKEPVLNEKQMAEFNSVQARVHTLLEATPPHGADFLKAILHILDRENAWVAWKRAGCPEMERPPERAVRSAAQAASMRKRKLPPGGAGGVRMGNPELDRLWNISADNLAFLKTRAHTRLPDVVEFLQPMAEQLDPDAGIDEEYKLKNDRVYCWKALRLIARAQLPSFPAAAVEEDLEKVVPSIIATAQRANDATSPTAQQQQQQQTITNQDTQDHATPITSDKQPKAAESPSSIPAKRPLPEADTPITAAAAKVPSSNLKAATAQSPAAASSPQPASTQVVSPTAAAKQHAQLKTAAATPPASTPKEGGSEVQKRRRIQR
eukprot:jgi/Chlat1/1107/Chrsp110S08639